MIWGKEYWDVSFRNEEMSVICNGESAGVTFEEYVSRYGASVIGTDFIGKRFPLLVKVIKTWDILSVQVHPDDVYARLKGGTDTGKNEAWYIITPPTDGYLIIGLKDNVTKDELKKANENGTIESCLNKLKVKEGDLVNIPSGLVHALTPGAVIAEIQQNSDITYRLYDYNRVDANGNSRELHIEDALKVADFENKIPKTIVPEGGLLYTISGVNKKIHMISNDYFNVYKYTLFKEMIEKSNAKAFCLLTCVSGEVKISTQDYSLNLQGNQTCLIPAGIEKYILNPAKKGAVVLKTVPGV